MVLLSITAQQLFQMVGTDINVCIPGFQPCPGADFGKKKEVSDHMFPVSNCPPPKNLPLTIEFRGTYSVTSCLTLLKMSDLYTIFVF